MQVGQKALGYPLKRILDPSVPLPENIGRFCFENSVRSLREKLAYKLLISLAIFQKPPVLEALDKVAGLKVDPLVVNKNLTELQKFSLVYQQEKRYAMLPITHKYVLEELANHLNFEKEARERWVKWYLNFVKKNGGRDWENSRTKYDQLEAEWENILAVLHWCVEQERYTDVRDLWQFLNQYTSLYGYWHIRIFWLEWLIKASKLHVDWKTAIYSMSEKSLTLIQMGQFKEAEALLLQAWNLSNYEDFENQTFLVQHIALLCIHQKEYQKALDWLKKEKTLAKKANFQGREFIRRDIAISTLEAEIYYKTGDYEQAKKLYQQVVNKSKQSNWQRRENYAQNMLANIAIKQKDLEQAEELLAKGLPVAEHSQDKWHIAYYKASFAYLEKAWENLEQVRKWATQAMDSFNRLGMIEKEQEMDLLLHSLG